jgi:type IV secretory pathway VirB2 component (pilin)
MSIVKNRFNIFCVMLFVSTQSFAGTSIGAPSSGFFSQIGGWLQTFVDFLEGPWGLFICVAGLIAALTVWVIGTRSGEGLGMFGRVILAGIMIINVPSLIIALKAF